MTRYAVQVTEAGQVIAYHPEPDLVTAEALARRLAACAAVMGGHRAVEVLTVEVVSTMPAGVPS